LREYIWLNDMPVAVVDNVNTSPVIYYVQVDHLLRPARMTDASANWVWDVIFTPFGTTAYINQNPTVMNIRFPGQWFQLETGLAYNWHRHYDATTGRYVQPDPMGLKALLDDGPNAYGYGAQSPLVHSDRRGLCLEDFCIGEGILAVEACATNAVCASAVAGIGVWVGTRYFSLPATPQVDCDCEKLYNDIDALVNELQARENSLKWPTLPLPPTGKMSVAGHVQQFQDKQIQLRSLLNEANTKGCLAYRADAWNYATMLPPS
jgi:RHS repeat-associated protein